MLGVCNLYGLIVGILSLDQENVLKQVDHVKSFLFWDRFVLAGVTVSGGNMHD